MIVRWLLTVVGITALVVTSVVVLVVHSEDACATHGGHEVFQYDQVVGKTIVPIYKCEGAR